MRSTRSLPGEKAPKKHSLGKLEGEILSFIAQAAPVPVRTVAEAFAERRGLARTTVLTVMRRLLDKGFLERHKLDGVFHFSPTDAEGRLVRDLVCDFVEQTMGGRVSPFLAYLAEGANLSRDEISELRALVDQLEDRSEGEDP